MFLSRDVLFKETIFPFKLTSDTDHTPSKPTCPSLPLVNPANIDHQVPATHTSPDNSENSAQSDSPSIPHFHVPLTPSTSHTSSHTPTSEPSDSVTQSPSLGTSNLRRSTRVTNVPKRFDSYVLSKPSQAHSVDTTDYFVSLNNVLTSPVEPSCYDVAKHDPTWVAAMDAELKALEDNQTWDLTTLPPDAHTIDCKWVFKTKFNPDGSVERCKARLVARGDKQIKGKDFKHTFSPVAKFTTVRTLIALAAASGWHLKQLDINNAFLHGYLTEDIYMLPPPGYSKAKPGLVCKLRRSLYGLRQASREWNKELSSFLISQDYVQSSQDYSLFVKKCGESFTAIVVYVDDLLVTGNNIEEIDQIKSSLHQKFTIKDLGNLKYFLGIEVLRTDEGIQLNQRKYILDLLADSNLTDCNPAPFPLSKGLHLSTKDVPKLPDPEVYRRIIGKLLYLNLTRPDISYAVQQLSQFLQEPAQPHYDAALHVLKYLKGTLNVGLFYKANTPIQLTAYSDADWGTCSFSAKSLSGYAIFLGSSLVSWKTKKQKTVSKSSAEAEYRSMSYTTSEIIWLEGLLQDLHITVPRPINLYCDNTSAQHIAENQIFQERTKHLKIDCHFIREYVQSQFLKIVHISTFIQLADILTKPLDAAHHKFLSIKLGLHFDPP